MDGPNNSTRQQSSKLTARQEKQRLRNLELVLQQRDLSNGDRNDSQVPALYQDSQRSSGSSMLQPKRVTFRDDLEVAERTATQESLITLGSNIQHLSYSKTEQNTYNSNTYYQCSSTPGAVHQEKETRPEDHGKLHRILGWTFSLCHKLKGFVTGLYLNWKSVCISALAMAILVLLTMLYGYLVNTTVSVAQTVSSWAGATVQSYPVKKSTEAAVSLFRWLGLMAEASTTASEGDQLQQTDASESMVFNVAPLIQYIPQIFSVVIWGDTVSRAVQSLVAQDVSPHTLLLDTINMLRNAHEATNNRWAENLRAEFRTFNGLVIRLRDIETAAIATGENRPLLCMIPRRLLHSFGLTPTCDLRERLLVWLREAIDEVQTFKTGRQRFNSQQGFTGAAQVVSTNVCRLPGIFTDLEDKVRERRGPSDRSHLAADEEEQTGDLSIDALDKAQELLHDQNDGIQMSCNVMKSSAADSGAVQQKMAGDIEAMTHVASLLEQTSEDVTSSHLEVEEGAKRAGGWLRQLINRQEQWGQRHA